MSEFVYRRDQFPRQRVERVANKYGWNSDEMIEWGRKNIGVNDSLNLIVIREIIDEYGWPGKELITEDASFTIFLVLQHSGLEVQEEFLPVVREAVKAKKLKGSRLAYLEDRILVKKGEHQIYGTQMGFDENNNEQYVLPVINPEKINERRKSLGLMDIEDYLKLFDMHWDLQSYKKNLPRYLDLMNKDK